jgi:N-acetylglucosamine-6-sulfatase
MRGGLGFDGARFRSTCRRVISYAVVSAFLVMLPVAFAPAPHSSPAGATPGPGRPNVVVFMTDDQTLEQLRVMPKVQSALGDKGVTFSNFVVSNPRCCPSRATFLTGQYSHNNGVMTNRPPDGGFDRLHGQKTTLPAALQGAGYQTIHIGKYLNGYGRPNPAEIPRGWDTWLTSPSQGTYSYWGFTLNKNGALTTYSTATRDYHTDVMGRLGVKRVEREAERAGPFFMTISFLAPHGGSNVREPPSEDGSRFPWPAPRHDGDFKNEPLPLPPSFDEADISDKPIFLQDKPRLSQDAVKKIRSRYRAQLESLLAVDDAVDDVVRALGKTGERNNTLLVFTSDNGYYHGQHRIKQGKVIPYEPAIRVPLVMRGPGVVRDAGSGALVSNIDLAPTILDFAGAAPLRVPDGRSLRPLLANPAAAWENEVLLESGGASDAIHRRGVRTPEWKYVEWINSGTLAVEAVELYDLVADPDELVNRAGDPAYVSTQNELAARLATLRTCAGATCHP